MNPVTGSTEKETKFRRTALWAVVFGLTFFFYTLSVGLVGSNDGSHYALFRALEGHQSTELREYSPFAMNDHSVFEGKIFSDRSPGMALFWVAYHRMFGFLKPFLIPGYQDQTPPYRDDLKDRGREIALLQFLGCFLGGLTFFLMMLIFERLRVMPSVAWVVSLSTVLGTIIVRYATVLYSHLFSTVLVLFSFWCFLRVTETKDRREPGWVFLGAFCFSYAVISEYIVIAILPPMVYWLWRQRRRLYDPGQVALMAFGSGLLPFFLLGIYNQVSFGSPFWLAHFSHATFAYHAKLSTTFEFSDLPERAFQLLWRKDSYFFSLFEHSPFFWIFVLILPFAWGVESEKRRVLALTIWIFVASWLAISSFVGFSGGADSNYRQMLFGVPFLGLALGLVIDRFPWRNRWMLLLVVGGLAFHVMDRDQIPHVRHANQNPRPARWANLEPALRNVPVLFGALCGAAWVMEFLVSHSAAATSAGRRRRREGSVKSPSVS